LHRLDARLKVVNAREVERRILRNGGTHLRDRGSHRLYEATDGRAKVLTSVAFHPGDIPTGTLRKIEKDMEAVFGKGWLR
jgi:predicted RNA binding protein YcfA (HicA-like mRNA interferase family)